MCDFMTSSDAMRKSEPEADYLIRLKARNIQAQSSSTEKKPLSIVKASTDFVLLFLNLYYF